MVFFFRLRPKVYRASSSSYCNCCHELHSSGCQNRAENPFPSLYVHACGWSVEKCAQLTTTRGKHKRRSFLFNIVRENPIFFSIFFFYSIVRSLETLERWKGKGPLIALFYRQQRRSATFFLSLFFRPCRKGAWDTTHVPIQDCLLSFRISYFPYGFKESRVRTHPKGSDTFLKKKETTLLT